MNKVANLDVVAGRSSGCQTVLIGSLGDKGEISRIVKAFSAKLGGVDHRFVTLDGQVNENADFQRMLSEKGASLISSGPEIGGLPSSVSTSYVEHALLVERIRAGGAGIPAFYVEAREARQGTKEIDGKQCALEEAVKGTIALVRAVAADREGNARLAAENKHEMYLAMSADYAIVIADAIVETGAIDPEYVHIPGLLVDAVADFRDLK